MFFALSALPPPQSPPDPAPAAKAHHKVKVSNRVAAKSIDLLIVMASSAVLPYPAGPLFGFVYSLFADGSAFPGFQGQSIGKKLLGLQVVSTLTGKPAHFKESALRNSPVAVATFFGIIPVWGWLILGLIGVPLMIMEIYLMLSVATGHRLGDVMGDTEVLIVNSVA